MLFQIYLVPFGMLVGSFLLLRNFVLCQLQLILLPPSLLQHPLLHLDSWHKEEIEPIVTGARCLLV